MAMTMPIIEMLLLAGKWATPNPDSAGHGFPGRAAA
jgi:hypothetical protein